MKFALGAKFDGNNAWLQTGLLPLQSTAAPEKRKCRNLLNSGTGTCTQMSLCSQRSDKAKEATGTCVPTRQSLVGRPGPGASCLPLADSWQGQAHRHSQVTSESLLSEPHAHTFVCYSAR